MTDESWLATIELIEPRLLSQSDMADLRWVLDHTIERRGGKSIKSVAEQLIARLKQIVRTDVPQPFLEGLIERLDSGKKYTRRDSDREYGRLFWREDRDRMIVYLYDYIYDALIDGATEVHHEIFGAFPVPRDSESRSEKALAVLDNLLTNRSIYDPPARSTLLKIVTEDPNLKRRPRT